MPVEYAGLSGDRIVVGARREAVEVRLQTVRWLATRLGSDSLEVRVNLADIGQGDRVVDRVTAAPASVQIKGPRTTIESRDAVPTAPGGVSGSRQTVARTFALALPESVIATKERAVHVIVEIRPEEELREAREAPNP